MIWSFVHRLPRLTLIKKAIYASNDIIAVIILFLNATLCLFSSSVFIYYTEECGTLAWVCSRLSRASLVGSGEERMRREWKLRGLRVCLLSWLTSLKLRLQEWLISLRVFKLRRIGCRQGTIVLGKALHTISVLLKDWKGMIVLNGLPKAVLVKCKLRLVLNLLSTLGISPYKLWGISDPHLKSWHLPKLLC